MIRYCLLKVIKSGFSPTCELFGVKIDGKAPSVKIIDVLESKMKQDYQIY